MSHKTEITEEMGIHKEWYSQAKEQTMETLPGFLSHLMDDYEHDYGTICHALAAGAVATAWAMNHHPQGGISGCQAGFVMWGFIRHWQQKQGVLRLVEYDNMLYPQYADSFAKTISQETWDDLQQKAQDNIEKHDTAHPDVRAHWESIINGVVPFGYSVKDDD